MVKYLGYRLAQGLSLSLPAPAAFSWAERLADGYWRHCAKERAAVQANLQALAGGQGVERPPVGREVFRHFGRYLVEFFTIHRMPRPQVHVEGAEHLAAARRQGAIILTAHLGNWEVGAITIRRMGVPIAVVALPHDDPRMDGLFNRQRRRCGIEVIPLGDHAAQQSLRTLRQGRAVGIIGDRNFAGRGVCVAWGNRRLILPRGPAILSLRAGVPVIPAFLIREGVWRFRLYVEPAMWPKGQEREEAAVQHLTQRYAAVIERYVTRFPAQWLMFKPVL